MDVLYVVVFSWKSYLILRQRAHTGKEIENPVNAINVIKLSSRNHISLLIIEFKQERNPINMINVIEPSKRSQNSLYIREPLERNRMTVLNMK